MQCLSAAPDRKGECQSLSFVAEIAAEPPCGTIRPRCGSIGFEVRFRDWRNAGHASTVKREQVRVALPR